MYSTDKYNIVATLSHFQELPQSSSLKAVSQNSHNDFLSGSGKMKKVILAPCFILKLRDLLQQITHFIWFLFAQMILLAIVTNIHMKKVSNLK